MSSTYKVYIFFLKHDDGSSIYNINELYAFTINKEYKNKFLYQRNKKCFFVKKVKMDETQYGAFSANYHDKMLWDYPINTSLNEYESIISTSCEDDILTSRSYEIDRKMDELFKELVLQSNLKKKYTESIQYLCTTYILVKDKDNKKESISTFNLLFLFMEIFQNTFIEHVVNDEDDSLY